MTVKGIDINQIKQQAMKAGRVGTTKSFDDVLMGAAMGADAFSGAAGQAASMYGAGSGGSAAIAAAFSGVSQLGAVAGNGSYPSYAAGYDMGGYSGMKYSSASLTGSGLTGTGTSSSVIPGTEGFSQMDMINTMNSNNLQLLELQALMQSNMQSWNTKSNILSADHRARMAMIEKFTARG